MVDQLDVKVGQTLDRAKLRSSLKTLYRTGRFSNIQAEARREPNNQVSLVFTATENFFNGNVTVTGRPKHGPTESQLINASKLQLGDLYSRDRIDQGIEAMRRVMQDFGFYETQITYTEIPHPETQQMDIAFNMTAGPVARIGKVIVNGDAGMSPDEVAKNGKLKAGKPARNNVVPRALQRLRKKYTKQQRLEAQIAVVDRKWNPDANTIDYTFDIQRGPVVDIRTEGAKISRGRLRRYVPVYEENAVDDDLLNEGRRNIRDYLQTQGYFDATVQVAQQQDPKQDRVHIIYDIDRGERRKLQDLTIQGNKYFGTEDIRALMVTTPSSVLLSHGRYSQGILNRDLDTIQSLYQSNGFQQVKVTSEVVGNHAGDSDKMQVIVTIDEGPQSTVNTLSITGNELVATEDIRNRLTTIERQPFSDANIGTDRNTVINYYFNQGFPDVQLETTAAPHNSDPTKIDVVYKITEGPRVFVDRVMVSGIDNTKPDIVNREFEIRDGSPFSQASMVESQRRLYDLGIFNEVDTAVQNPEGEAKYKNVLFNIREARRWTLNYGLGFEIGTGADQGQGSGAQGNTGISPRASLDVTRINFRGRNQSLIFKSRYGRFVKRALASFDSPRWFDLPNWRLTLSAYYDDSRDVNTFASERVEASTQLTQVINRAEQLLYRFSYRRVKVDENSFPGGFSPDLIPLYSRPVRVGMPSITYIRDRRDDPLNSTRGSYWTFDAGLASGIFGSEADFGRILAQYSSYHRFGNGYVLARSTRIGVESPFSNSEIVPLPERFFVGGGNSHRGFAINQAGPRDPSTGGPLGGNAMFVNNIELRLPPAPLPFVGDNLSFVVFHDMGNAFSESREMWKNLLRFKQKNPESCRDLSPTATCDFNYISHAIGAGVRYRTPIGPVRVDLGYNLNPPVFPIKQASTGVVPHSETVKRLNFVLSIGQTF